MDFLTKRFYKRFIGFGVLSQILPIGCILLTFGEAEPAAWYIGYFAGWVANAGVGLLIGFVALMIWCFD